jgi:hypothetical protein
MADRSSGFRSLVLLTIVWLTLMSPTLSVRHTIQWSHKVKNLTTAISSGDTVAWNWTDSIEMSVQSASTKYSFQSSPIISQIGAQYEVIFPRPGKFPYRCSVHPMLGGMIQVSSTTSSPTLSPTASASAPRIPPLVSPQTISSGVSIPKNWNMNLYVRESRVSIGDALSFNTRTFCLRPSLCSYLGPTIRVRPGDNVTIYLTNQLSADMGLPSSLPRLASHGANTTNLFFHGLRLSPNSSSFFRQVGPGETATLVLSVQPNHAPGLHWYRSQNQGFSTLHALNGLVGAVIVEPETSNTKLNYPASLKSAEMTLLVVTKLVIGQETVEGVVSQGCGPQRGCDPLTQSPLCSGAFGFLPPSPHSAQAARVSPPSTPTASTLSRNSPHRPGYPLISTSASTPPLADPQPPARWIS